MRPRYLRPVHPLQFEATVLAALEEDLGRAGDLTTDSIIPVGLEGKAEIVARAAGVIAGLDVAGATFGLLDSRVTFEPCVADGQSVEEATTVARVRGPMTAILSGERVALNLLGRLSGIATATRRLVDAIDGTGARIVCTRKTTPGLRALEKYAVRAGGGWNHRFGLDDAVLVKDNHLAVAGSVTEAVRRVREEVGHLVKVEVEVDTLDQLEEAIACDVDAVLLDNMTAERLTEAVQRVDGRLVTEASGGITLETARTVAEAGVDLISVGWLTHSAPALDIGLDVEQSV